MLTEKDYCDYKLILELKELGYDYIRREGLIHLYDAQKWLREEKKIIVTVSYYCKSQDYDSHWYWAIYRNDRLQRISSIINYSYEEALSEGVKCAVKILKEDETIHG